MSQIVIPSFKNAKLNICTIICCMKSGHPPTSGTWYLTLENLASACKDLTPRIWPKGSSKFSMKKANGQWPRFLQANKGKTLPQALLCHWHISLEVLRDEKIPVEMGKLWNLLLDALDSNALQEISYDTCI